MTIDLPIEDNLELRQFRPEDSEAIFCLVDANRAHLAKHNELTGFKYRSIESVLESIVKPANERRLRFGIWQGSTLVGSINLTLSPEAPIAEVGYYLAAQYQGKRYTTRALKRLVHYAFEDLELEKLFAHAYLTNLGSQAVLYAAGFREEPNPDEEKALFYRYYALRKA